MQSKNDVIWDQNLSKLFLDIKASMNKKLQTVNLQIVVDISYTLYDMIIFYVFVDCSDFPSN